MAWAEWVAWEEWVEWACRDPSIKTFLVLQLKGLEKLANGVVLSDQKSKATTNFGASLRIISKCLVNETRYASDHISITNIV